MESNWIQNLKNNPHIVKDANLANEAHQSIALILRSSSSNCSKVEVLILQRCFSPKDAFSGDLCLPGGKV